MRRFFISVSLAAIVLTAFGCSAEPAENAPEPANVAVAANPQITDITDPDAAFAEGNRLLDENQTQLAIEAYRRAVGLNPDLADAYFQLGIAHALLAMQNQQAGVVTAPPANGKEVQKKTDSEKAFEKAVKAYEKRIDANGQDHEAYFNLGRTYVKLLKDEDAEKAFKQAVKLKPDDAEYQTELGAIQIILAQYHEAIVSLKKAIDLDGINGRAQDLLEDAQAGRQRIDYVSNNKNTNQTVVKKTSNSNANMGANSNSNSTPKPPPANTKPKKENPPEKKPNKPGDRPRIVNR